MHRVYQAIQECASGARVGHSPVFLLRNNPPADSRLPLIPNPGGLHPYLQQGAEPIMKPNSGVATKGIERILELSADAQIPRRGAVKNSPQNHKLTAPQRAYATPPALLTA